MADSAPRGLLPERPSRYDALLLAMPIAFVGTFLVFDRAHVDVATALAAASISSGVLGGVGVFGSPPTDTDGT